MTESRKSLNNSNQVVSRLSKIKIFDFDWLKANWNLQGSDQLAAVPLPNISIGSLIMPKVESFLQASQILEKLDEEVREENHSSSQPGRSFSRKTASSIPN